MSLTKSSSDDGSGSFVARAEADEHTGGEQQNAKDNADGTAVLLSDDGDTTIAAIVVRVHDDNVGACGRLLGNGLMNHHRLAWLLIHRLLLLHGHRRLHVTHRWLTHGRRRHVLLLLLRIVHGWRTLGRSLVKRLIFTCRHIYN